jgi:serine/threonine protein kinase/tetratricopeptide (TPR) repeat protein
MSEHWQRVSDLLDELLDLEAHQRSTRLTALAVNDPALAAELTRLLAADERSGMLDAGVARAAPTVMSRIAGDVAAIPAPAAIPGKQIGHYRLLERIGTGGMGDVWRAERGDGEFEQQVAIKLIRPLLDSPHLRGRFARERRILARLDHPNIARLLDGGVSDDGTPWYAMEFVRGIDIVRYAQSHALDTRARVELLLQVCEAVAHAHSQLVVHRDLKPSNILVDADARARVLDFGIARMLDETADSQLTGTGVRMFSPLYAAPEQIRGESSSTATDVYALGVILFELLTGEVPHPRRTAAPDRLLAGLHDEVVVRPSQALRQRTGDDAGTQGVRTARNARELSGDLDTIVTTALQPEPTRRYTGAARLGDDLRRWLDGHPIAAQPDTAGYRMRKFVSRHRIAVGSASAVLLALIAGLGIALWQADVARRHAARADLEARRANAQAQVAQAVSDFLTSDVIQAANPYRSSADITLSAALIAGGERIDQRFAADPRLAGVLHRELGDALRLAGVDAAALLHGKRAVDLLETAVAPDDDELLKARANYAYTLLGNDGIAAAREQYQRALADLGPDDEDPRRLPHLVGLAGLLVEETHEVEALAQLELIMPRVVAQGRFEQLHIDALNHKMRALMHIDRIAETQVVAKELREGAESVFGVGDPRTFEWLRREAIVLIGLDRYAEALELFERVCPATRRALGADHPSLQECHLRQGVALFGLERYDEAAALIEPVAEVRERTLGRGHQTMWTTWIWLGRSQQMRGRLDEARATFIKARDAAAETMGPEDSSALPYVQTYGMFLHQTGELAEALALRKDLVERSRKAFPNGHINVAKYAWDVGETLAAHDAAAYVNYTAEWLPRWIELFGEQDSRTVKARKWLADAQQRSAGKASP